MIETLYQKLLLARLFEERLGQRDGALDALTIDEVKAALSATDLSKPQLSTVDYRVDKGETSSAAKWNSTFRAIGDDLSILYEALFKSSDSAIMSIERWKAEVAGIERRMQSIGDRIDALLFAARDTDGYYSFFVDNINNFDSIDKDYTTALVDTAAGQVYLGSTNTTSSLIRLPALTDTDVSFRLRSSGGMVDRRDLSDGSLSDIFKQNRPPWSTRLVFDSAKQVAAELTIKLDNSPVSLNSIYIKLADSAQSGPVNITPLYSLDNYTYMPVPTQAFSQDVKSTATFMFDVIQAAYIKFVLTKAGPDSNASGYAYVFGFDEILFYHDEFETVSTQTLVSKPLALLDRDGAAQAFSRIRLDACERIDVGTSIDYYVTVSNNAEVPIDGTPEWIPISPSTRQTRLVPSTIDVGDLSDLEYGDIGLSFDVTVSGVFANPAQNFEMLSYGEDGNVIRETVTTSEARYLPHDVSDCLLSIQVKDSDYEGSGSGTGLSINQDSIQLFRNVGEQGLSPTDATTYVRGVPRGWRFEDPYYVTIVEINNPFGIAIDIGKARIIVDGKEYISNVPSSVLTGETADATGIHEIKIHQDFWTEIEPGLNDLDVLKAQDPLYPNSPRYLIEGYAYGASFPSSERRYYKGVSLFASHLMKFVSVFDFTRRVEDTDLFSFTIDRDIPGTHENGNEATQVFVVKFDPASSDFQNERFALHFKTFNRQYKYLRLKAVLATTSPNLSPVLDSYKLKFGD